jgi:hypothetical protein
MEKHARDFLAEIVAAVVAADGRINVRERRFLPRLDALGLGSVSSLVCRELDRASGRSVDATGNRARSRKRQKAVGPSADLRVPCAWLRDRGPVVAGRIVAALAELAACDGELTPEEIQTVLGVASLLGLRPVDARVLLNGAIVSHGRCHPESHAMAAAS